VIACWVEGSGYCEAGTKARLESELDTVALTFQNVNDFHARDIHFHGVSVKQATAGADGTIVENTAYENCIFEKSPVTSLNFYFYQTMVANKAFDGIFVTGCEFFEMGYAGITIISWPADGDTDANRFAYAYTRNVVITDNVFYNAWTDETDAAGTTPEKAPGIILNRVWQARAQRNTFIRMAGSGLWSTQTHDLFFSQNVVAYSRRVTDACANHVDIQNDDSRFERNVGYKNEGGFFESMGLSDNNVVRFCVSVDDGQEDLGDGERIHHANSIFLTGYAGQGNTPMAPTNITLHNNLVVSTNAATQYYRFINEPKHILLANNEFVVGGGSIESLSTIGVNYEATEIIAASNLIGGRDDEMTHFTDMFTSSGNALLPEDEALSYADEVAAVVADYIDGTDPSLVRFEAMKVLICAVENRDNVMRQKSMMEPHPVMLDTDDQHEDDFCGRTGNMYVSGNFIGAIRPTLWTTSPTEMPTTSPTGSPTAPRCENWCAANPNSWDIKCSGFNACVACEECITKSPSASPTTSPTESPTFSTGPYRLWWSVDNSASIVTPPDVIRGDRGLPVTRYNEGNNGNVTNVYGNKGNMPKYYNGVAQNGGIPQNGSLEVHLDSYRISLAALIPEEDYAGVCMLDFEHWRADWNSSYWEERERAVAFAGDGNVTLARELYEEATKRFMLATINETRVMRPGCLIGWYGYPRNPAPFVGSESRYRWCGWHADGAEQQCGSWAPEEGGCLIGDTCFFENNIDNTTLWMRLSTGAGYHTDHGSHQRLFNDGLSWLFEALDVLTPSIYLALQSDRYPQFAGGESNRLYVEGTVAEARRLADNAGAATGRAPPLVLPLVWARYNDYWDSASGPSSESRRLLPLEEARVEFLAPMNAGADGVIVWGNVQEGERHNASSLQRWVDDVLNVLVDEMNATPGPIASPTNIPTASPSASPNLPTASPTASPTESPTSLTVRPSSSPSTSPTPSGSPSPTTSPTAGPTTSPTKSPSNSPAPVIILTQITLSGMSMEDVTSDTLADLKTIASNLAGVDEEFVDVRILEANSGRRLQSVESFPLLAARSLLETGSTVQATGYLLYPPPPPLPPPSLPLGIFLFILFSSQNQI
jgi:hypothetical protein